MKRDKCVALAEERAFGNSRGEIWRQICLVGQTTSGFQPAPDASSSKTICPTEYPAVLATWSEFEPAPASAVTMVVLPQWSTNAAARR
jgi:hypothetical protein